MFAVAETWPEVFVAALATFASCFTSYLAYRSSRQTAQQVKDSTVLTRSTDVEHTDRIEGAARREED